MNFGELKAKIAGFKKTGELDKAITAKLMSLVPVKQILYKLLADAADSTFEFESDDKFLNWLNDIASEFVRREQDPRRGTARIFVPARKISMGILEADKVYRNSIVGLVAMIRAAPPPPIEDWETRRVEARYKVKVV